MANLLAEYDARAGLAINLIVQSHKSENNGSVNIQW